MTTVNFNLSTTLQNTLTNAGANTYAYAFAFGASTAGGAASLVSQATLVEAGVVQSSPSLSVTSNAFYSGAIYVVIQQGGDGTLPTNITSTNDIIDNAASGNYSYQLFEATLSGSQFDLGDISAVNSFGFTSTYEVVYQSGSDTRGFNTSGSSIFAAMPSTAVVDFSPNAFPNAEMLASGPATADNQSPWPSSGWQTYADALKNDPTAVADIQIVYSFGGSPLQAAPMLSQYGVEYVASDKYGDDYFWLVPDTSNGATNTDWIRIPVSQLVQNIFVQGGSLEVHQGGKDGTVFTYDSFTPNNADGGVAKHFVAGFDAGFWGGVGSSPNADVVDTIDFNKGYNWNVNFAYNAAMLEGLGSASFINTLVPSPGSSDFTYDPWAQQFVAYSNAYGYSYSDLVSAGGVNPQISLWDTDAGANVETINISLYDTGETPASGFAASSQGWIEPTNASGNYEDSLTASTNQIGFDFNFSVGTPVFAPNENTPIAFKIYAPSSAQADGDGFIKLSVTGTNGDWYYYILDDTSGTWSFQLSNATGESGFFDIQNIPVTDNGSPSWYQLEFGEGDSKTTYNIYATSDADTGAFTSLVVDHGIEVTENANGSYTLDFAPGGHMFYDINTFAAPPTSDPSSAGVTIKGSKKKDFVNALTSVGAQQLPTGGADIIYGDKGDDYLSGLGGNDTIDGGKGVDMVRGNDGDDILLVRGSEGVLDYFNGGEGTDTLQLIGKDAVTLNGFKAATASIEIIQGNGRGLYGTKQMDVLDLSGLTAMSALPFVDAAGGHDILTGSDFADHLRGGDGDDTLNGSDGHDTLNGDAGADILSGDDGNDTLNGGKGIDALDGGVGDDVLVVRGNEGVYDTFDGGTDTDTLRLVDTVTLAGFDASASSIEILQGNGRELEGTKLADVFDLSGLTAAPVNLRFIDAKGGNDTLIGSAFDDNLRGGEGDDVLDGRAGHDILDGGKGNNTFVFADGYDNDRIVKFQAGKDKVDLTGVTGVSDFSDLVALMDQTDRKTVVIDFGDGDTLTIEKTTIAVLTASQGDFLFS